MKTLCLGLEIPPFFKKESCRVFPLITTEPIDPHAPWIQDAMASFDPVTHLLFTSQMAVFYFKKLLEIYPKDLENKKWLACGPSTAEKIFFHFGKKAYYQEPYSQEGVISLLKQEKEYSLLFPKATVTRDLIENFLQTTKNCYTVMPLYQTRRKEVTMLPALSDFDALYFSAPSVVDAFFFYFPSIPPHLKILLSGPVTKQRLQKYGGRFEEKHLSLIYN